MEVLQRHQPACMGKLNLLPPEILERVMANMSPLSLVPLMLSCTLTYQMAQNERIWNKVYKKCMPNTHTAILLAPNPEFWKFRYGSSIKFVYEHEKILEKDNSLTEVEAVMRVMRGNPNSRLIQRAAVYILRRLSYLPKDCDVEYGKKIEGFRYILGCEGAMAATVRVLNNYDEEDLLAGALCALGNLVIDDHNSDALVACDGLSAIVSAMSRHSTSFPILDFGSFALCNLDDGIRSKDPVFRRNAPNLALDALRSGRFTGSELLPPMDLLIALAHATASAQSEHFKRERGKEVVDVLAEIWPQAVEYPNLMSHSLSLGVVICEGTDETRDYAIELGFIDKAFDAIDQFKDDPNIFTKAALLLFSLFWRNEAPSMAHYRTRLIRLIISTMKRFKDVVFLQRTAAAMLSDLSHLNSTLKSLIVELGGKELVRAATTVAPGEDVDPEWLILAAAISIDD